MIVNFSDSLAIFPLINEKEDEDEEESRERGQGVGEMFLGN